MLSILNSVIVFLRDNLCRLPVRKKTRLQRAGRFELLETRTVLAANVVMDINPNPPLFADQPAEIVDVNGIAYFKANSLFFGEELWRSDGTADGTKMLLDIFPGKQGSRIANLINLNGTLFFSADDGVHGNELWKSDGTPSGTVLVKDIFQGAQIGVHSGFTPLGSSLFFTADDGVHGRELWKSDGSLLGTELVSDVRVGDNSSYLSNLIEVNGTIYFVADDGPHGRELWKSDGTSAGTSLLKDISPGINSSFPNQLTNIAGSLYFNAHTGSVGQPWKTDGSASGTVQAVGMPTIYSPAINVNGTFYFQAKDAIHGPELWKSDGATAVIVDDIRSGTVGSYPTSLTNVNGTLYFRANDGISGTELWKIGGTSAGAVKVADVAAGSRGSVPTSLTNVNGTLYFRVADYYAVLDSFGYTYYYYERNGFSLWKSDGTAAGTEVVKDLSGSSPTITAFPENAISNINGTLFFRANDFATGEVLWKSDGTAAGTQAVKPLYRGNGDSSPDQMVVVNNQVYFRADDGRNGRQVWKSDGTAGGTAMLTDLSTGIYFPTIHNLTNVNGKLYFNARSLHAMFTDDELWESDGTRLGTRLVAQRAGAAPDSLTDVGGTIFFASSNNFGRELWKSNGTASGTVIVKDIFIGGRGSSPKYLTNVNGMLYFSAGTSFSSGLLRDVELWRSDGTAGGTFLVKDIESGLASSNPSSLTNINGTLYFTAFDSVNGNELWKSDGTTGGTSLVKDIAIGTADADPTLLTNVNGIVYFVANDLISGQELWKSDGTPEGTVIVKDLISGSASSNPASLTNVNGTLYFLASDGVKSNALWKSDGTASGTVLVKDILTDGPIYASSLVNVDGSLFFTATDIDHGTEVWKSSDNAPTAFLIADVLPGPASSLPANLVAVNNKLFFVAFQPEIGRELFTIQKNTNHAPSVVNLSNSSIDENLPANSPVGDLTAIDPDPEDVSRFSLLDGVGDNDQFAIAGTTLVVKASLDYETRKSYSVTVRATDRDGVNFDKKFVVNVNDTNEAPLLNTLLNPALPTLNEDVTNPTGGSVLSLLSGVSDVDAGALKGLALTQTSAITKGKWQYSLNAGATWIDVGTVSTASALLLPSNGAQSRIRYLPNANVNGNLLIGFQAWDQTQGIAGDKLDVTVSGGTTAFSAAMETATLKINAINDAPVIDVSQNPAFSAINEDTTNSSGNTVLSLMNGVSDVDLGALQGLALTQYSGGQTGKWQYSLNAGLNWIDVGVVSTSSALLLPSNGVQSKLRYVPNANFNGTVQIAYRAWDQTQGSAGDRVNVATASLVGGTKAYSKLIETASLLVLAVNDAPVLDTSLEPKFTTLLEDATNPSGNSVLSLLAGVSDTDQGALRGLALVQTTGNATGIWQYTLTGGANWSDVGVVSASSALLLPSNGTQAKLRYIPGPNFNGTVQVSYRAWDQTQGSVGARVNVASSSLVGGTKAYSTAIEVATLTINPQNDAPVWLASTPVSLGSIRNNVPSSPSYSILSRLLNSNVSDADSSALKGIAIVEAPPVTAGTWWYQLSGTTNWIIVHGVSPSSALLLPSSALLQFRPVAGFVGTAQLRFHAWDQSSGLAGGRFSLISPRSSGGTMAFSVGVGIAELQVTL